jgi:pimeloyl-ACP methyl ester carboxylesterase
MSTDLSPAQAAEIADSAYALRLSTDMLDAAIAAPTARSSFDLVNGTRLAGFTGLGNSPIRQRTGFGYVAKGSQGRQGECLVSIRGTFKTSAYDWLSNLRMAGVRGPSGYTVHAGFWAAAQTLLPQIRQAIREQRDVSTIHVVGHSLGGAIATLVADSLGDTGCKLQLYTFGAPRAGVSLHAQYLTQRLGAANIHRVYHDTDPVPMVPVFPYSHVPWHDNAYRMKGPGKIVCLDAHMMPEYRRSVGDASWNALPVLRAGPGSLEQAEAWLKNAADAGGASIMLSATALRWILSALGWILKQLGHAAGLAILGGSTIIDTLAQLLYTGALQSLRLATMVSNLISAIMRFMGRTVAASTNITVAFVEYVLGLLFRFISTLARQAVDAIIR